MGDRPIPTALDPVDLAQHVPGILAVMAEWSRY